jgi:hypothetical protein
MEPHVVMPCWRSMLSADGHSVFASVLVMSEDVRITVLFDNRVGRGKEGLDGRSVDGAVVDLLQGAIRTTRDVPQ